MKKQLFGLLILAFAASVPALAMGMYPKAPSMVELQSRIADQLGRMDTEMAQAAIQLSSAGLTGSAAGQVLQNIYDDTPAAVDVATIGLDGKLLLIQPDKYKGAEGDNISSQPHFALLKKTGKPVMSGLFKTVEGFHASSLAYPVFGPAGKPIGYVSMVFKPDALIGNIAKPYIADLPQVEVLAIQLDGRVIYDRDIMQIGKMTFSDLLYQPYPKLLELAKRIVGEPSGTGSYLFPGQGSIQAVNKQTEWATVSLHGTEWRVILSQAVL